MDCRDQPVRRVTWNALLRVRTRLYEIVRPKNPLRRRQTSRIIWQLQPGDYHQLSDNCATSVLHMKKGKDDLRSFWPSTTLHPTRRTQTQRMPTKLPRITRNVSRICYSPHRIRFGLPKRHPRWTTASPKIRPYRREWRECYSNTPLAIPTFTSRASRHKRLCGQRYQEMKNTTKALPVRLSSIYGRKKTN